MSLRDEIFEKARMTPSGDYLLPRKYSDRPDPKWDACRELVESGHARWMSPSSDYSPGIVLTGKPLTDT